MDLLCHNDISFSLLFAFRLLLVRFKEFIYHEFTKCADPMFSQPEFKNLSNEFGQNVRWGNWSGVCVGSARPCTGEGKNSRFFLYDMKLDQVATAAVAVSAGVILGELFRISETKAESTNTQNKRVLNSSVSNACFNSHLFFSLFSAIKGTAARCF